MAAQSDNRLQAMGRFLDLGADPLQVNVDAQTPLDVAVQCKNLGAVHLLLKTRAYDGAHLVTLLAHVDDPHLVAILESARALVAVHSMSRTPLGIAPL